MSQKARAALKYISGVGAEPRPPRFGPSSQANVMWPVPARLTVATFRNGVTDVTSASKTISRRVIVGSSPSGVALIGLRGGPPHGPPHPPSPPRPPGQARRAPGFTQDRSFAGPPLVFVPVNDPQRPPARWARAALVRDP